MIGMFSFQGRDQINADHRLKLLLDVSYSITLTKEQIKCVFDDN